MYKLNFKVNKKVDLLLVDNNYADFKFENINYYILKNEIYLIYLIQSFIYSIGKFQFNLKTIKENYQIFLIKSLSPKIVIGHDMNGKLLKIKKLFPKIISICYQLGNVWAGENKIYKKIFSNNKIDYYFIYDKRIKKILKKIIKTKFIISGALKNNEILVKNFKKKKYDIMYISQFRKRQSISERKIEAKILKLLDAYCLNHNKKLLIALAYNQFKIKKYKWEKDELEFINQNCKKFYIEKKISPYTLADMSKTIVCFNSNLGLEMLAKEKKIIFFDLQKLYFKTYKNLNKTYILDNLIYENFEKKIKFLFSLSKEKWKNKIKKDKMKISFDKNNFIFKNLIFKLIK